LPAGVVILSGSEPFLEHAALSEATFIFLLAIGLYAMVRAWHGHATWAMLAGAALGMSIIVRTVGLAAFPFVLLAFLFAATVSWRARLIRLALILAVAAIPVTWFLVAHKHDTGYGGFTANGYFDLYGRVGPFADCKKFKPPKGTEGLCIHIPVSKRQGNTFWEFNGGSPAIQMFGAPEFSGVAPRANENTLLRKFAVAAVLGQPLDYLEFVGRGLVRIVDPSFSPSPYGTNAALGQSYGSGPQQLVNYYFDPNWNQNNWRLVAAYYPGDGAVHHDMNALLTYERGTRIVGPVMAIFLLLALVAPILNTARHGVWRFCSALRRCHYWLCRSFCLTTTGVSKSPRWDRSRRPQRSAPGRCGREVRPASRPWGGG
jgi:hypothetical protein